MKSTINTLVILGLLLLLACKTNKEVAQFPQKFGGEELVSDGAILNHIYKSYNTNFDSLYLNKARRFKTGLGNTSASIIPYEIKRSKKFSSQELYANTKTKLLTVCRIYLCSHCPNKHVGTACAFPVTEDGYCVTNFHVFNLPEEELTKTFMVKIMDAEGTFYEIDSVVAASEENDVVIFKIDTKGKRLSPYSLSQKAEIGSDVFLVSHPQKRFYRFSEGIVARHYYDVKKRARRTAITAPFAVGSSGAPVLNNKGQVIGLVSSTTTINNDGYFQMTEYEIISVDQIKKLISH